MLAAEAVDGEKDVYLIRKKQKSVVLIWVPETLIGLNSENDASIDAVNF